MTIAARIPLCIALIALATLALSGIGVRQGWWTLRLGFQMLEWSAYGGLAAAACAIFMMIIPKLRTGAVCRRRLWTLFSLQREARGGYVSGPRASASASSVTDPASFNVVKASHAV